MKKIFIPTPLDESIVLPKDVTHHILHVFRHNILLSQVAITVVVSIRLMMR